MAYSFLWVSVVMMAVAASVLPCASAASLAAAAGMPRAKGSMTIGWPITPVEEGRTSFASMFSALPTSVIGQPMVIEDVYKRQRL